jgi:soluble lytic murein transglycosylase
MKFKLYLFFTLLSYSLPLLADELRYTVQRIQFLQANELLRAGDMAAYADQREGLENYPLYYYLEYSYLRKNFDQVDAQEVETFLNNNPNTPLAELLEARWFEYLAAQEDWATYVRTYTPQKSVELQCHAAYARLQTEQQVEQAWADTRQLWLVGKSQPTECDPLFALWYASPHINTDIRKARMNLALQSHNVGLARFLANNIDDPAATAKLSLWQQAQSDPAGFLRNNTAPDSADQREVMLYATHRLARKDPRSAHDLWDRVQLRYQFSAEQKYDIAAYIAMRAHYKDLPEAEAWLMAVPGQYRDDKANEALFRLILKRQDWRALLGFLNSLPRAEKDTLQWRYWLARALAATGKSAEAEKVYRALATHRDYYAFLAADKLGIPYSFVDRPIDSPTELQQALMNKYPGLLRAREFFYLGMTIQARREWVFVRQQLNPEELLIAADMARDWQWFERAIVTAAKANAYDDLDLRFPLIYRHHVQSAAAEQSLDSGWVYGVMRRESAFSEDIRSSAGALGLMQLLPSTAEAMAHKLDLDISKADAHKILAPDNNIRLGSAYLRRMLDRFDDNYMLATASYNAGPGRISRWRGELGCVPADLWVEYIPFRETRNYVKRVMEYTAIFDARMGNPNARMRLQAVSQEVCQQNDG